jgi:hypothetical protein
MAAKVYFAGLAPTLAAAARSCGSNLTYTQASITLVKANDPTLLAQVLSGERSLLGAAREVRPVVTMLSVYGAADEATQVAVFRKYDVTHAMTIRPGLGKKPLYRQPGQPRRPKTGRSSPPLGTTSSRLKSSAMAGAGTPLSRRMESPVRSAVTTGRTW